MYVNSLKLNNNQTHNLNCIGYSCTSLQVGMREGGRECVLNEVFDLVEEFLKDDKSNLATYPTFKKILSM
jgi:hypothetical protein